MIFKIFDLWDTAEVKVEDPGLKRYVSLDAKLLIKSHGKSREKFGKARVNVVERLINLLQVPGHRGKKHKIMTKWASGKFNQNAKIVINAFKRVQEQTKQNPIQIFVRAIENSSPRDEITVIEYGGARYPQACDVAPSRRISLSLHNIVHGAYDKCFNKKKSITETLAEEIILASQNSAESFAISKRNEAEKQADAAR